MDHKNGGGWLKTVTVLSKGGERDYNVEIFTPGDRTFFPCPVIWLHGFPGEGEKIWALTEKHCVLICVSGIEWNTDLSPWPAPKAFDKGEDFGGKAAEYLDMLVHEIMPDVEARLPFIPEVRGLAGYSMAGLFAVYAMYHSDCFDRIGTMSGSLWFDGWEDYARAHQPLCPVKKLYVSLGNREHRVRNARMSKVLDCTEALVHMWRQEKIDVLYERNSGGHFSQPLERTARGIDWLSR